MGRLDQNTSQGHEFPEVIDHAPLPEDGQDLYEPPSDLQKPQKPAVSMPDQACTDKNQLEAFPPPKQQAFPPSPPPQGHHMPQAFPPPQTGDGHRMPQAFPPPQARDGHPMPQAFPPPQARDGHPMPQAFPSPQAGDGHRMPPQAFPPPQPGDAHRMPPQAFPPPQPGDGHRMPPQAFPPPQPGDGHRMPPQDFPPPQPGDGHRMPPLAFRPSQPGDGHRMPPQAFPPPQPGDGHPMPPQAFPPPQTGDGHHISPAFPPPQTGNQLFHYQKSLVPTIIPSAQPAAPGPGMQIGHPAVGKSSQPPSSFNTQPPTQPWKTGLFDCMQDPQNAVITALFPCMTFGQIAEIVDSGNTSCVTSGMLFALIAYCIAMPCIISFPYRSKMRSRFGLLESPAPDWVVHCFCEHCALCQEYRELEHRGFDPSIGWAGNVAREQQRLQLEMAPPMPQRMM